MEIFSKIKDSAEAKIFITDNNAIIRILWTLNKIGFGELVLLYNKEKDKWDADTEKMDKRMITKILKLAAPDLAEIMMDLDK